ncbi:beta-galactosidase [Herbiconiux sp. KACC 21604]|uniref:beta-galactosidase n=1 Tax=unclassified Herbiconiux TaxID=2618217 RepID=UPI0014927F9E|nr:beta-galactosidase [Herbiconiux sp. SALV-R1]QJU55711.1 beta-galactosidase [Herbiconiux sp. SALV-R1]WPO86917.1 beta-galactosidase [Herbiconiux sp. KACC 21604]
MYYGGDYYPEQWDEATWVDDVRLMREAGVNLVSLGVFAWARIQPEEGAFDFAWLDRVMELLHDGGIGVDLATATASPPPWAHEKYPEMLPRDVDGHVVGPGSRQHYAPTSPVYRRLAAELVTALAGRYADHPAVQLWHVNNEYGCHLHQDFSDSARDAFQQWLRDRYSLIDAVNEAWGTDFWSQRYGSFTQILPPRRAPYSHNPGQLLDFRRFTSDALLECYRAERDIIRAAGATQPITTNFMGAFKPADYWAWAQEVDVISDDCYPDPADPESFRESAMARDLMRSLKPGVPWLLMEQSTGALNWRPSNAPKAPGQMTATSMQAVARGASGILFFQWRQSRAGAEKFHSAMLPHAGTSTRIWREVVQLGASLAALPALPDPDTVADDEHPRVAIVFDWHSWWAIENPDHPVTFDYLPLVRQWYAALHRAHVTVDFVRAESDLSGYAGVFAPALYLLSDDGAASLERYVEGGGHLLVTTFSDVVDESDRFRPGGFLTRLGPLLGVRLEEFGALLQTDAPPAAPGQRTARVTLASGEAFDGTLFAEQLELDGATALGTFTSGRTAGLPAVTSRASGKGRAYFVATMPDAAGTDALCRIVFEAAGVQPLVAGLPLTVEVSRRGDVLFLVNHGAETVTVEVSAETVVLEPYGSAVLTAR